MALTLAEQRTIQFYDWERRGRGWYLYEYPVDPEPPFTPFYVNYSTQTTQDDGIAIGFFESLANRLFPTKQPQLPVSTLTPPEPIWDKGVDALRIWTVVLPQGRNISVEEAEHLLAMLSTCTEPVSFEILADSQTITLQFVTRGADALHVVSQLKAYFPDGIVQEKREAPWEMIRKDQRIAMVDLGLREEFMRPLDMADSLVVDPFTGLIGMMDMLQEGELAMVQVLFKGVVDPWVDSIHASVTDIDGKSFFADAPDMPKLARAKTSSPLFGVVIRLVAQSHSSAEAQALVKGMANTLCLISQSPTNSLIPLSNKHYPDEIHLEDIINRQTHRLGMLLNSRELVNFVHFPSASVVSEKLHAGISKTKRAPETALGHSCVLGINTHQGVSREVSLSNSVRLRHTHIIGATGTGKSTLLLNLITQDITNREGVAVLDPHGDLIDRILERIPPERQADVILIDPSNTGYPVGFNILSPHSEIEKETLSSDLVSVFKRFSTSWGDQMNSVLANAILAFLESSQGGTLFDLRRFLVEKDFRESFLKTVTDPTILYYWQKQYPIVKTTSLGPILTRLDTFLRPKPVRYMVAQQKSPDFEHLMDTGKILLVKLPQGLIGDENSYLLGTLLVSKIYQTAMARQAKATTERPNFWLYIDEFQHFITPSMAAILSGARKYHLGLILAHQSMQQLVKYDHELADAVVANAATRICFRLGDTDAKRFGDTFSYFDEKDLQDLPTGEAIVKIERPDHDFNLRVRQTEEISQAIAEERKAAVIASSQAKYGTPKEQVDQLLHFPVIQEQEEPKQQKPEVTKQAVVEETVTKLITKQQPTVTTELSEEAKNETKERLIKQKQLSQHRYLQTLIKKMAEARGYKATLEALTPDGQGRVDVSLEREGKRIACEIGVTTTKEWEVHNIEKCLQAGYEVVVAIPVNAQAKEVMQRAVSQNIEDSLLSKVMVMEADALFQYLDRETVKDVSKETKMKGYRVKVEYDAVSQEEMKMKQEAVVRWVVGEKEKGKQ